MADAMATGCSPPCLRYRRARLQSALSGRLSAAGGLAVAALDVLGGTPALLLRCRDVQPRSALLKTEAGHGKVSPSGSTMQ